VHIGPGINYQIPAKVEKMEWHLNTKYFGYGYGWIFPHKTSVSIGAYGPEGNMSGKRLKNNLLSWASKHGYFLEKEKCQAAMINYDYRGYDFDKVWLIGDAAGLASGLTGEGIYPAIVSGETVARKILDPESSDQAITDMVKKQQQHHKIIKLAANHPVICSLLMESLVFMLKCKLISFHTLEMATAKKS
jgi:geranylgeranyl reductase